MAGLVNHYGVLSVGMPPHRRDEVLQLNGEGYSVIPLSEFADGGTVTPLGWKPPLARDAIVGRIRDLATRRPSYNFVSNNCEHAARWAFHGDRGSGQTGRVGAFGLFMLGML